MQKMFYKTKISVKTLTILGDKREIKTVDLSKINSSENPLEKYFIGVKGLKNVNLYGSPATEFRQFSRLRFERDFR